MATNDPESGEYRLSVGNLGADFGVSHEFPKRRSVMRRTILALTVVFLAPTAVMAMTAGPELVGDSAGAVIYQIAPGGVAGIRHEGLLGGNVILAMGDKSGTGPGKGGHKGQHKAERKGGQKHEKKS